MSFSSPQDRVSAYGQTTSSLTLKNCFGPMGMNARNCCAKSRHASLPARRLNNSNWRQRRKISSQRWEKRFLDLLPISFLEEECFSNQLMSDAVPGLITTLVHLLSRSFGHPSVPFLRKWVNILGRSKSL